MSRRTTWAATGWLLLSSLRLRRRELARLVGWSLLEAGPTLLSGLLLARAVDDGFLAGRTGLGLAWLGALAVTAVLGAWATRQASLQLASVVEPFRDELVHMTVRGALHRSTAVGENPDTAGVARMTHQVEVVREAYASMIMVVQAVLVSTVSALIGLLALVPMALVLVLPPLLLGVVIFLVALRATAARQRDAILAEEDIARATSAMTDGLRDVVACGAERRVAAAVGRHVETQARAVRDVARMTAVRSVSVGVGGWGPLVVVLLASPWLVDNGATAGAVLGVITYVMQGLLPALQTLVDGMGESGLWLAVTLHRIVEAATPAGVVPPGRSGLARNRRAGRVRARLLRRVYHPAGAVDLELRGVTFGYGRRAEPVVDHLDLRIPAGDHLAVVGPSGVGKSTLAGLLTGVLRPQEGQVLLG
ncbi:MAG TPA: ABC transporter ATP-binding protein, partial [Pseudonocardiaceae bacterium]